MEEAENGGRAGMTYTGTEKRTSITHLGKTEDVLFYSLGSEHQ